VLKKINGIITRSSSTAHISRIELHVYSKVIYDNSCCEGKLKTYVLRLYSKNIILLA